MQQTGHLLLVLRKGENEGTALQMLAVLPESQYLHRCQGMCLWLEMCPLSVGLVMEQADLEVETGLVADLLLGQELSLAAASLHLLHLLTHNLHMISPSPISIYKYIFYPCLHIMAMCQMEACVEYQTVMNWKKYDCWNKLSL